MDIKSRTDSVGSFGSNVSEPTTAAGSPRTQASDFRDSSFSKAGISTLKTPELPRALRAALPDLEQHKDVLKEALDDGDLKAAVQLYSKLDPKSQAHKQRIAELNTVRAGDGHTPLTFAIANRDVEAVRTLLQHGVDVNADGVTGGNALKFAKTRQQSEIADLLGKYGAK